MEPTRTLERLHDERMSAARLERVDYDHPRGLDRAKLLRLARADWVAAAERVVIQGPPGIGKTYLACALGRRGRIAGHSVVYARLSRLLQELTAARIDGVDRELVEELARTDLLVIDEWGLNTLSCTELRDLIDVLDDRRGRGATLLVSHISVEAWYDFIGDPALASTFVDRMGCGDHLLQLRGRSMRPRSPVSAGPTPCEPLRARLLPA